MPNCRLRSIVGVALFLQLAVSLNPAAAQTPADFYKGKTLRIVVGYSPHGGYDLNARMLARFIGKHIPGNPTVIVENLPGASSFKAVRYLTAAPKDGTVVVAFSAGLIIESLTTPSKFQVKFTDYSWIGSISQEIRVCYVRASLGVKTFQQLLKVQSLAFGETGAGSAGYIDQRIMHNVLGVNLRTIIGYPGSAEKGLAVERGELDGDCISFPSIPKERLENKKINIIYRSSDHILPGMSAGTPYIMDLVKKPEQKQLVKFLLSPTVAGRPYIASRDIPKDRLAILRKAFDDTIKDPEFQSAASKTNLAVVGSMSGNEAMEFVADIYKSSPQTIAAAKKLMGK